MSIKTEDLLSYSRRAIKHYGMHVNEDRAFPDFKDGCKPVHRRSLYGASYIAMTSQVKSARLVGDVMGKYHPHGDSSIYGALVTAVNSPTPPYRGAGNWGTMEDNPAAMRYTEIQLNEYGKTFFDKDYRETIQLVPNYDGSDKEPVYLPALLPNVLFTGDEGMGVGITGKLPPYTPQSVIKVCLAILSGEKLTPKDFADNLVFKFKYGGELLDTKENRKSLLEFYKSNSGSVMLTVNLKHDPKNNCFIWDEFPPGISTEEKREKKEKKAGAKKSRAQGTALMKIRMIPGVKSVPSTTSKEDKNVSYAIKYDLGLRNKPEQLEKLKAAIEKVLTIRKHFVVNVTDRYLDEKTGKAAVRFYETTVPDLFLMWLKYRVKLEKKSLELRISKINSEIHYTKLMLKAVDCLDIIFKSLKAEDSATYLVKHMKISLADANIILDRQVRSLSKLSEKGLKEILRKQQEVLKQLTAWAQKPVAKVSSDLKAALATFKE